MPQPEVGGVVVDHVHYHTDAGIMEGLDHFFHFPDTNRRIGGVGRVAPFGCIVVIGVVSPVILIGGKVGLIYGVVIVGRKNVHVRDAQLSQMV